MGLSREAITVIAEEFARGAYASAIEMLHHELSPIVQVKRLQGLSSDDLLIVRVPNDRNETLDSAQRCVEELKLPCAFVICPPGYDFEATKKKSERPKCEHCSEEMHRDGIVKDGQWLCLSVPCAQAQWKKRLSQQAKSIDEKWEPEPGVPAKEDH